MMDWLNKEKGFESINTLGKARTPFLFIISYDTHKIFSKALHTLDDNILYKLEDLRNYSVQKREQDYRFSKAPLSLSAYQKSLDKVLEEIKQGNTYLLNLTFKTPIKTNLSLKEIFYYAQSKFKLYYKDEFVCFSPERFVEIQNNTIATYPMKGTIDATLPHAKASILANQKEMAEHVMIVDLMRNDLGIIGSDIKVEKFRYVEEIKAGDKRLLQISSKITAQLPHTWQDNIGTLLSQILPAGSITGTPKKKSIEIIEKIEDSKRGFYTGVFGIYDGTSLSSSVMIRFIEKHQKQLHYQSGGGITLDSQAKSEHQELIDKIYLPF